MMSKGEKISPQKRMGGGGGEEEEEEKKKKKKTNTGIKTQQKIWAC